MSVGSGGLHGPGRKLACPKSSLLNALTNKGAYEAGGISVGLNIVIPNAIDCLFRTILGIQAGTVDPPGGEAIIRNVMPKEVGDAVEAMKQIVEKLPASMLPHPPTLEELAELHKKRPEKKEKEE